MIRFRFPISFITSTCATALLCCTALAQDRAFPPEIVHFHEAESNPVFTAAGEGAWDARIRERGWILREGDSWKMWYTGYDGTREGLKQLGYATSPDGVNWTRHPGNPIYDEHWVEDMMIVRHEGTYYMFAEGRGDQAHLLTSADGIDWTREGQLDVRMSDGTPIEPGPYGTPTVWLEGGIWHLFYERRDAGIWLATSDDLNVWTNVQDEPVLVPGPGDYDRDLVAFNQIIRHDGRYYASYHGASTIHSPALWTSNLAVSDDLIHWRKYAGNPLFPIAANKSSGVFVPDGDGYRLYTMHNEVRLHEPVEEPGFVPLFPADGVPSGWHVRRWNDVSQPVENDVEWRVADGVARGSEPRGTWLVSQREYGDFELRFDWKLGDRGNSGCGLRFPAAGDPAFDGLELQMVDPRYYGDQRVPDNELTGGLYRAVAPSEQLYRPNDWNNYAVTCNGPRVTVELNGVQILDVDLDAQTTPTTRHDGTAALPLKDRPRRGHIGFQELSRTGHVQIRNARIRELPPVADGDELSLIRALSSDDDDVRFETVLELRKLGTAAARAEPALVDLLDDSISYVRRWAADALLRVGGDVELVLPLLEDSDQSVQLGVARSILVDGRKPEAAIPVLVFLACEGDDWVEADDTFEAFSAGLASTTSDALLTIIETEDDRRIRSRAHSALQRMDAIGPEHVARLASLLQRDEDDIREFAAERLAWLREDAGPAIPALQEALLDVEAAVRIQAALALLTFESTRESSVAVLQSSMDDGPWAVRLMSIDGVHDIRVPELVPQLIAGLGRSSVSWESYEALVALGRDAVPELVATIETHSANGDVNYRSDMIAKVFGGIGAEAQGAAEFLLLLSHDANPDVQAEAVSALGSVAVENAVATDRLVEMLESPVASVRQAAAAALQTTTPSTQSDVVRAELRNRLSDDDPLVRVSSARSLGELGEEADVFLPILEELLTHEDGTVVEAVLEAYKELGPRGAASVPSLIGMLNTDAYVPGFALGFESRVGGRSLNREVPWIFKVIGRPAVPALADALDHPDPEIRGHAAESLGLIGPDAAPAVSALVKLLTDDGAEARIVGWVGEYRTVADIAAEAIGLIGPSASQAIPALLQRLEAFQEHETSRENVRLVAQALGHIGPDAAPAVPALWVLSRTGGWWEQSEALAALARIQPDDPEVRETLKRFLLDLERDDPFAVNSIEAVGIVGDAIVDMGEPGRDLAPVLEFLIADAPLLHPLHRCEAAVALARIVPDHPLPERFLRRQMRIEQISGDMIDWARDTLEWLYNDTGQPLQ